MTDPRRTQTTLDKAVVKEALKEWLDDAFATFGKWTLASLLAAAFVGCVYLAIAGKGWIK